MTSKILITPLTLRSASAFWHSVKSDDDIPPAKIIFTVDITSRISKLKSSSKKAGFLNFIFVCQLYY